MENITHTLKMVRFICASGPGKKREVLSCSIIYPTN